MGNIDYFAHLSSEYSKTMQFRQKLYRTRFVYQIKTYNIVFYDHIRVININQDIWKKHAFLVRDFVNFWRAIEIKLLPKYIIIICGNIGLTKTFLMISYSIPLVIIAWHHSALKLPHNRKLTNFEGQKHPLKMVSR